MYIQSEWKIFFLIPVLIAIAYFDRKSSRVSMPLEAMLLTLCLLYLLLENDRWTHIIEAVLLCLVLSIVSVIISAYLHLNALGGADIRVISILCLGLGVDLSLRVILFTCVAALAYAFISKVKTFPLCPALCFGTWAAGFIEQILKVILMEKEIVN